VSFDHLQQQPADSLLSLIAMVAADKREGKIDLSVGVYRDESGRTPVFAAVKAAEQRLVDEQPTKAYLGPAGDIGFVARLLAMTLGDAPQRTLSGLQTPGGTGALRLAADLLAHDTPGRRIWLGLPSWPNHAAIFQAAGLDTRTFAQFDMATQQMRPEAILAMLEQAAPGDAVLLQGCCHNPTGADPDPALWSEIAMRIAKRGLLPLLDLAYHGLGRGLDEDAESLKLLLAQVPSLLVAYSCDKNFGLYRDRVGALFYSAGSAARDEVVGSNLLAIARANYSMPPDHGAAVVRTILESEALTQSWRDELGSMQTRIASVRAALAAAGKIGAIDLTPLGRQLGMFSQIAIDVPLIHKLRAEYGVYLVDSGRMNIAGMRLADVPALIDAFGKVQG
jgi:aromatic-amino-acid transaminase